MDKLLENPARNCNLDELAQQVGAITRTLERLFIKETGMTYSEWRNTLNLQEAIELLAQGKSVTEVAIELGYKGASAFIAMFKRKTGISPGNYLGSHVA